MRHLLCISLVAAGLHAQDAREIVRRSMDGDRRNSEAALNYTFTQHEEQRQTDAAGKVKKVESETWDVTLLEGSPYRRLMARNDHPLSAKEQAQEEEKLRRSIRERQAESPEARARRVEEWRRKQDKQREPFKEILDAFDLKLVGAEKVGGVDAWIIDATPHAGYRPRSSGASFFPKVKARCWISKDDYGWAKAELQTLDTITFGGFLLRMAKGSSIFYEATRVNGEVWLPKRVVLHGSARIALVKVVRGDVVVDFSAYKKFQTDSRLITTER